MKESEIRKKNAFKKYLKLVEKDAKDFFKSADFVDVPCPACASDEKSFEFEKNGFKYYSCRSCSTLFATPRPIFRKLEDFYSGSPSTKFWINEFFKPVAEARRQKIFIPRALYLKEILKDRNGCMIGDIGAGFGIFLEELRNILPQNHYVAIEPSNEMADICSSRGIETKRTCLEELSGMEESFNLLTAFELAEHLFDPAGFFKKVHSLLKPGGLLFLTTLNSKGFDILLLWDRSRSIMPPHHLNFFDTSSIKNLLERSGFETEEISTPGRLDWDIVEGMIKDEKLFVGRFWNHLADSDNRVCKRDLQEWISRNKLSSHMRILARRPE